MIFRNNCFYKTLKDILTIFLLRFTIKKLKIDGLNVIKLILCSKNSLKYLQRISFPRISVPRQLIAKIRNANNEQDGGKRREKGKKLQPDITNSMRILSKSSQKFETVKAFTGIMLCSTALRCTASAAAAASADSVATLQ